MHRELAAGGRRVLGGAGLGTMGQDKIVLGKKVLGRIVLGKKVLGRMVLDKKVLGRMGTVLQGMNSSNHNYLHHQGDESLHNFRIYEGWDRSRAEEQVRDGVLQLGPDKDQLRDKDEVHQLELNRVVEQEKVEVQQPELNTAEEQVQGDARVQVRHKVEQRELGWALQQVRELHMV